MSKLQAPTSCGHECCPQPENPLHEHWTLPDDCSQCKQRREDLDRLKAEVKHHSELVDAIKRVEAAGFLVVDREEADWHCVLWENRQGVSEPCEAGSTHDGDSGCHWRIFPVRC